MPSSTSSFKTYHLERIIPRHPWAGLAAITLILTLAMTFGWEMYCRHLGYAPTLNDTKDLWASRRALVEKHPSRTVLIGSSRMLFNYDLDVHERELGQRPIQLSTVGTNPLPYLEDLADNPRFKGTVIVGVTPGFLFAPAGPPMNNPNENLSYYRKWSPTQKFGHRLGMLLESRLAFLQQEDLTLPKLLLALKITNRPGAKVPPELPPYFYEVDEERQGGMTDFAEKNRSIQKRIQQIWLPLFTPPPFPPGLSESDRRKTITAVTKMILERTTSSVEKIRSRGGKVVFLRFPSTGGLRALENQVTPREKYWDRLIETTGSIGVHFEDYPGLRKFQCPEWSHLTKEDGTLFTQRFLKIYKTLHK